MKKIDITGWKKIYSFTFFQTLKSRAYKISLLVLCLVALISCPVMCFFNDTDAKVTDGKGEETDNSSSGINVSYFNYDKKDDYLNDLYEKWSKEPGIKTEYISDDKLEDYKNKINDKESDYCIFVINNVDKMYSLEFFAGWDDTLQTEKYDGFINDMEKDLGNLQIMKISGAKNIPESVNVTGTIGKSDQEYSSGSDGLSYTITLIYIVFFVFILSFAGESIASSVVTEKSGKMVEFLMISVRPMAILVGKVLAVITCVMIQIFAVFCSFAASSIATNMLFDRNVLNETLSIVQNMNTSILEFSASPLIVFVVILYFAGGLLLFSLIASLAGAAVSKIEELSEGIVLYTFTLIIGAYLALFTAINRDIGSGNSILSEICSLLPLSSPFYVPYQVISGKTDAVTLITSLIILYVCIVLWIWFASKVYEYMLFYNGATLKLKDIIKIACNGKVKEEK